MQAIEYVVWSLAVVSGACFVSLWSFVRVALAHAWLHVSMIDIKTDMQGCVHAHRHMSCAHPVDAVHRLAVLWASFGLCCIGRSLCVLALTTFAVCLVMSGITYLVLHASLLSIPDACSFWLLRGQGPN
jgi:hypothetical protein